MRLFDLAGAQDDVRFSPNCWRIRLALAHKDLPVETIPWRFTDKDAIAFSGQGKVPVLTDGERCIVESWTIAEYLEATYPDRPSLFGGHSAHPLVRFFNQWTSEILHPVIARIIVPDLVKILHPQDVEYFRNTREAAFGDTFENLATARDANMNTLKHVSQPLRTTLTGQPFLGGASPSYADHIVFGAFQWARVSSPLDIVGDLETIRTWREKMLDAYDGLARATPAAL